MSIPQKIVYKSLWHLSETQSVIQEDSFSQGSSLVLKSQYSLISLGTERLVATGKVPASLSTTMNVPYQAGAFPFPIKYGYSMVGIVQNANHPWTGKRVHLLHPHQDYCQVEKQDCFLIPDEIDSQTATLASNLETAVNAVWDAEVSLGDQVLVVGFGLIGSLIARLVQAIPGTELLVSETNDSKRALAASMGFQVIDLSETQTPRPFDIAFNCSAAGQGLQDCIDATGFESKIIELSWYGQKAVNIELGGSFHQQRKQIISSQVSSLPMNRRGRWDYRRRKEIIFNLLKNPIFKHHITQTLKFAVVPTFFEHIRKGKITELGICIEY